MFPKLERISLFTKRRDDIFSILHQFQYLISTNIHWMEPLKTSLTTIEEYLQENNICTDNTYCFHMNQL